MKKERYSGRNLTKSIALLNKKTFYKYRKTVFLESFRLYASSLLVGGAAVCQPFSYLPQQPLLLQLSACVAYQRPVQLARAIKLESERV